MSMDKSDLTNKAAVGARLKKAMQEAEPPASHTEIAELAEISPQGVSGWIKTGRISRKHLTKVCDRLNITLEWLLFGRSQMRPIVEIEERETENRRIPVISYEHASHIHEAMESSTVVDRYDTVGMDSALARELSNQAFALVVMGDSMLPDFKQGDIVIIDPGASVRPGDIVVANFNNKPAILRRYRDRGEDANGNHVFELVPMNDAYPTLIVDSSRPGHIIGPVVEHRRKLR